MQTLSKTDLTGAVVFTALNKTENPTLKGRHYSPAIVIDTVDEILYTDPKTGEVTNEIIRYKPGEKSILLREQKGQYDNDGKIVKYEPIILYDGRLIADKREMLMLKYLRACNANLNPKYGGRMPDTTAIFKERDAAQEADEFLKDEKEDRALLNMIDNMEVDELVAYALVLGDAYAAQKKGSEIRRDLILLAKNDPKKFRLGTNNANMKRKVHVMRALGDGYIKYDKTTRMITWADGSEIAQCPIGKDPADYIVELSFQPAYETMYASIEKRIDPKNLVVKQNTAEPIGEKTEMLPEVQAATEKERIKQESEKLDEMIPFAIEKGVITRVVGRYGLEGTKKGEKYFHITTGRVKLKLAIEADDNLHTLIKQKLFELEENELSNSST